MRGLTVRWSLTDSPEGVEQVLRDYVADTSYDRFAGKPGLGFKTWRMRSGEWFEGCYVFETDAERAAFEETFAATMAEAPGSLIVGSAPVLVEACEVLAVAEGAAGFVPAARVD